MIRFEKAIKPLIEPVYNNTIALTFFKDNTQKHIVQRKLKLTKQMLTNKYFQKNCFLLLLPITIIID